MNDTNRGGSPYTAQSTSGQPAGCYRRDERKKASPVGFAVLAFIVIYVLAGVYGRFSPVVIGIAAAAVAVVGVLAAIIYAAVQKNRGASGVSGYPEAGHMCSSAEHARSEAAAASDLDDMESGYRSHSYSENARQLPKTYLDRRMRPLTREQFAKKLEELDSLLDAGMITREEYHEKREEYSRCVS